MNRLLLLAALVLVVAGCGSAKKSVHLPPPRNYVETMERITIDIGQVDKHLIGAQYVLAEQEAEAITGYSGDLGKYDPLRMGEDKDDFTEYLAQCEDLRRISDRMLYLIQQRRREEAKDILAVVAARYNRLSRTYGPGNEVSLFERPADKLRGLENQSTELPGELTPSK